MNEENKKKIESQSKTRKSKSNHIEGRRRILTAEGWKRRVASYFYYKHQDGEEVHQ